jgi:hypothetical protein
MPCMDLCSNACMVTNSKLPLQHTCIAAADKVARL